MTQKYMSILKLNEAELKSRRAFFEITDEDLTRLAGLRPLAEKWGDKLVDQFYAVLLNHPETRAFLADPELVRRLKRTQAHYFLNLFAGKCDLEYVVDRLRVGHMHERIGLAPKFYIGAYRKYLQLVHDAFYAELSAKDAAAAYESIGKLVAFDEALAIDTYIAANLETLGRHQQAIRELSTPVIRVHAGILLLPLVGAVDSVRAQQIMESVLVGVVQEQAKCVIIDIAGVPVVDTKVADNLIKTTTAVSLLGAKTILTGISAQIARTIVQLGVDISVMQTKSKLADGIVLALELAGKQIVEKH
jgi:rsbT co-antagonist protein RsbR